ncbi:hypothetical protein U1Q18_029907 [Sarracenia purpurea var. burkii]
MAPMPAAPHHDCNHLLPQLSPSSTTTQPAPSHPTTAPPELHQHITITTGRIPSNYHRHTCRPSNGLPSSVTVEEGVEKLQEAKEEPGVFSEAFSRQNLRREEIGDSRERKKKNFSDFSIFGAAKKTPSDNQRKIDFVGSFGSLG